MLLFFGGLLLFGIGLSPILYIENVKLFRPPAVSVAAPPHPSCKPPHLLRTGIVPAVCGDSIRCVGDVCEGVNIFVDGNAFRLFDETHSSAASGLFTANCVPSRKLNGVLGQNFMTHSRACKTTIREPVFFVTGDVTEDDWSGLHNLMNIYEAKQIFKVPFNGRVVVLSSSKLKPYTDVVSRAFAIKFGVQSLSDLLRKKECLSFKRIIFVRVGANPALEIESAPSLCSPSPFIQSFKLFIFKTIPEVGRVPMKNIVGSVDTSKTMIQQMSQARGLGTLISNSTPLHALWMHAGAHVIDNSGNTTSCQTLAAWNALTSDCN